MYLLDTNVISDLADSTSSFHSKAAAFVHDTSRKDQIFTCVINFAEMRFGLHLYALRGAAAHRIEEVTKRIDFGEQLSQPLPISVHVAREQAQLRAAYAQEVAPRSVATGKKFKNKPPELWHDGAPASVLGITENDLWIAAVAIVHDLQLVTRDTDFSRLYQAYPSLQIHKL